MFDWAVQMKKHPYKPHVKVYQMYVGKALKCYICDACGHRMKQYSKHLAISYRDQKEWRMDHLHIPPCR